MFAGTKTDEAAKAKQKKAREEALERQAKARGSYFGVDEDVPPPTPVATSTTAVLLSNKANVVPTGGQLMRNKRFADAFGIRNDEGRDRTDSFLHEELVKTVYPEPLKAAAKENVTFILKLERKWKEFILSKNASCQLPKMNRELRTIVHEYSDFFKFQTESFDLEPNRYVNCVKMLDSRIPDPLLSVGYKLAAPVPAPIIVATLPLEEGEGEGEGEGVKGELIKLGLGAEAGEIPKVLTRATRMGGGFNDFISGVSARINTAKPEQSKPPISSTIRCGSSSTGNAGGKIQSMHREPLKLSRRSEGSETPAPETTVGPSIPEARARAKTRARGSEKTKEKEKFAVSNAFAAFSSSEEEQD